MTLVLNVEVSNDSTIENTAEEMQRMADSLLCVVQAQFNGCLLLAGAGGSSDILVLRYKQTLAKQSPARCVSSYRPSVVGAPEEDKCKQCGLFPPAPWQPPCKLGCPHGGGRT